MPTKRSKWDKFFPYWDKLNFYKGKISVRDVMLYKRMTCFASNIILKDKPTLIFPDNNKFMKILDGFLFVVEGFLNVIATTLVTVYVFLREQTKWPWKAVDDTYSLASKIILGFLYAILALPVLAPLTLISGIINLFVAQPLFAISDVINSLRGIIDSLYLKCLKKIKGHTIDQSMVNSCLWMHGKKFMLGALCTTIGCALAGVIPGAHLLAPLVMNSLHIPLTTIGAGIVMGSVALPTLTPLYQYTSTGHITRRFKNFKKFKKLISNEGMFPSKEGMPPSSSDESSYSFGTTRPSSEEKEAREDDFVGIRIPDDTNPEIMIDREMIDDNHFDPLKIRKI